MWPFYAVEITHAHKGQPLQTNSFDCGMWVLVYMFTVLRGYDMIQNVGEADMPEIQHCILRAIYNLRHC